MISRGAQFDALDSAGWSSGSVDTHGSPDISFYPCTVAEVRDLLQTWHRSDEPGWGRNYGNIDEFIDHLVFGHSTRATERAITAEQVRQLRADNSANILFGSNSSFFTPYSAVRGMVRHLGIDARDMVYDLGAGYGTFTIYTAIVTEAGCKAIELMGHRTALARQAISRLELSNAEVVEGDVLDQDFSDGTVFFMFNPFSLPVRRTVMERLGQIAEARPVKLILRRMSGDWLHEGWLGTTRQTWINESTLLIEAGPKTANNDYREGA